MKRPNRSIALLALALAATSTTAQTLTASYAGEQTRAIKALSEGDVAGLLAGQGAGFAKAAELNGYPGPAHTLELKERLGLNADQVLASEALMSAHRARARDIGAALVQAERLLDALFAARSANATAVDHATREVGLLHAKLRAEHLNTHLTQTALLSAEQVARYSVLRGYDGAKPADAAGTAAPQPKHPHH
jgi:hypothetical protein